MLQQTQVQTVIPYFLRFMSRFPSIKSLAEADQNEVLHYWSGLGYYARARNLHQTAKILVNHHRGQFPKQPEDIQQLPGIGKSTAAAIAAISMKQQSAILEGNVKRILARFYAIEGWPGKTDVTKQLWAFAEALTPAERSDDYTQAIMDLGAMVCTPRQPLCLQCPVKNGCKAFKENAQDCYPSPKPHKTIPTKKTLWLLIQNSRKDLLLLQNPQHGLWGGLWVFPECPPNTDVIKWCHKELGLKVEKTEQLQGFRHTFSHYHLEVSPILLQCVSTQSRVMDNACKLWYKPNKPLNIGLASPVKQLITQI
jgi:A/G-specific adenine glycosylase